MQKIKIITLMAVLILSHNLIAKEVSSPYLKILNKDSDIDRMPLLMTAVDVDISGLIAEIKVTQIYKNYGNSALEGQYVFPGSRRAAVHKVTMKIGDRLLEAEIQEKKQARKTYEKAKSEGKTASLLVQKDPGLFSMNVANILPDDEIEVELVYTERLIPENGKYSFTYPAIGIPSVLNNKKGQAHIKNDREMGFDMIINIDSPIAIDAIQSLNHAVDVEYLNNNQALISLDVDETLNFKDDFVIEYSLLGNKINSGVLVYEDEKTGDAYFLMMLEPPKQFKSQDLIPKEYIFVIDSSGSMSGTPLKMAQFVTKKLLSELKPNELFNVVLFAGGSQLLSEFSMSPTPENIQKAIDMVEISYAGGSTNLLGAIQEVEKIPLTESYSRSLLVLTDGAIDVSNETLDLIRSNNDKQNVFAIGVSQYNNDMPAIQAIAQAGNGQEFIIAEENKIAERQEDFLNYVRYPLLTDIQIELLGFTDVDIQPQHIPDLFSSRPLYMTGKFSKQNKGSIEITGNGGNKNYHSIFDLARFQSTSKNEAIKYLWAKEKIMALGDGYLYSGDENKAKIEQITNLGLSYNLLTSNTSFVAVDTIARNQKGSSTVGNLLNNPEEVEFDRVMTTGSGYGFIEENNVMQLNKKLPIMNFDTEFNPVDKLIIDKNALTNRPSITFILGTDKHLNNQYYSAAEQIFKTNNTYKTDFVITNLTTISAVKGYLKTHALSPWGIINVVTHSSPWSGLSVKLKKMDNQILDVFSLNEIIQSKDFKPLDDTVLDANTEIRFLGCSLGKHQQLLRTLAIYFGGRDMNQPAIISPKDFVYMMAETKQIKTFKNGFALINPSNISNKDKLLSLIIKKNPQLMIDSLNNWKQKLVEIATVIDTFKNSKSISASNLAKKQKNIALYLQDIGAEWSDFKWSKTVKNNKIELVGSSVLMTQVVINVNTVKLKNLNLNDANNTTIIHSIKNR